MRRFPIFRSTVRCLLALTALACTFTVVDAFARESVEARAALDRALRFMGGPVVYDLRTLVIASENRRVTELGSVLVPTRTYYAFPLNVRHEIVVNGRTVAMASSPTGGGTLFTEDGAQPLGDVMRIGVERATMRNPVVLMKARLGRAFEAEHFGVETIDAREADRVRVSQQDNETELIIEARTVVSRDPLPDQGEERRGASDRGPLQRVEGAFVRSRLSARGARRGERPPGVRSHDVQRGG